MLPKLHAQRHEYETHPPVWWKHVNLPGQIGELERMIETIAQEIAADQQKLASARTRLSAVRMEFSTDAIRHKQRVRERAEEVVEISARMNGKANEGKRLAVLLLAHREPGTPEELAAFNKLLREMADFATNIHSLQIDEMFAWGKSQYANQYIRLEMASVESAPAAPQVERRESRKRAKRGSGAKRDPSGYVYLLRADTSEGIVYKIGETTNPKSRKRTFDVRLPFPVEMIHTIKCPDRKKLEDDLHRRYAAKCLRGSEFYALSAEDVAEICAMKGVS
jgi:hypothetical protein